MCLNILTFPRVFVNVCGGFDVINLWFSYTLTGANRTSGYATWFTAGGSIREP